MTQSALMNFMVIGSIYDPGRREIESCDEAFALVPRVCRKLHRGPWSRPIEPAVRVHAPLWFVASARLFSETLGVPPGDLGVRRYLPVEPLCLCELQVVKF